MTEEGKLAALIVRNISDIEAAYHFACTEVSERLRREMHDIVNNCLPDSWVTSGDEEDILLIFPRSWNKNYDNDSGNVGFWLAIDEYYHEDNDKNERIDHSWIGAATHSEPFPSRIALWFNFEHRSFITEAKFKKLLQRESALVDRLHAHGFVRHESGKYLLMPISIDIEELACAYEQDDFEKALMPIRAAIRSAVEAEEDLNQLVYNIINERN